MDEKSTEIVQSFMNVELVTKEQLTPAKYSKVPLGKLAAIGAGLSELFPAFREITETLSINPGESLYRAVNAFGEPAPLQYLFDGTSDYMGAMIQDGKTAQAHFQKVKGLNLDFRMKMPIDPFKFYMLGALVAIEHKVDEVKELQTQIIEFLEADKRTEMEGTLAFLSDAFEKYRFNWNNEAYRNNMHLKTQDIKQEAEHNILFYRRRISEEMGKKSIVSFGGAVNDRAKKLSKDFDNYQLAVYLSAFASFMEVMYLCNFDKDFLNDVSHTIEKHAHQYMELYTDCYNLLEQSHVKSVESILMKGVASASGGIGRLVEKIPVVSNTQLDENLIASEEKMNKQSHKRIATSLHTFTMSRNSMVQPFIEMTNAINDMRNESSGFYFDDENLYVPLPV